MCPWPRASDEQQAKATARLQDLATYQAFAEKGVRNLHTICQDAVASLGDLNRRLIAVKLGEMHGINADADMPTLLPKQVPSKGHDDPWWDVFDAYRWGIAYRGQRALTLTVQIGRRKGWGPGTRATCEVVGEGTSVARWVLFHTADDRADWTVADEQDDGLHPIRLVGVDDVLELLIAYADSQTAWYRGEGEGDDDVSLPPGLLGHVAPPGSVPGELAGRPSRSRPFRVGSYPAP